MTEIYPLREFPGVSLAIMPRPRAGDWLQDEIASFRRSEIHTVVSLLEAQEVAELGLEDEQRLCLSQDIRFVSFPIPDRGVPVSYGSLNQMIKPLIPSVCGGQTVAIHCRAGIGCSGLVAASILIRCGIPFAEVFPALSKARGIGVPDTDLQADWVKGYSKSGI